LNIEIEVCIDSVESAVLAKQEGATRVELCDNLLEGGTTPSAGMIAQCRAASDIQLYVMIRPRGGDFLYSDSEFEVMREDVKTAVRLGADGVVFGLLTANGAIDEKRTKQLIADAKGLGVTVHRAIDMTADPLQSLHLLAELGVERILTSGQYSKAPNGHALIQQFIAAKTGVKIMPGSGVNAANVKELVEKTGAQEIHFTCHKLQSGLMQYRNEKVAMGANSDEYQHRVFDVEKIRAIRAALGI
jgi:copper homeostasis protein